MCCAVLCGYVRVLCRAVRLEADGAAVILVELIEQRVHVRPPELHHGTLIITLPPKALAGHGTLAITPTPWRPGVHGARYVQYSPAYSPTWRPCVWQAPSVTHGTQQAGTRSPYAQYS